MAALSAALPRTVDTVATIAVPPAVFDGIAFDGHDIWLAAGGLDSQPLGTTPITIVERRDARTAALLGTTRVTQEAQTSIAADGAGSVYVAGGGDGGIPDTTVSKIDTATGAVLFTRTLGDVSCSCKIVADSHGVWMGANGSAVVLRLDPTTGGVIANIALPAQSFSIALVGGVVEVGLANSSVAVIDTETNTVSGTYVARSTQVPPDGAVFAITPWEVEPGIWNSLVHRSDGESLLFMRRDFAGPSWEPAVIVSGTQFDDDLLFGVSGSALIVFSARAADRGAYRLSDTGDSFGPLTPFPQPGSLEERGLAQIVTAGGNLWIADQAGEGRVRVVRPT